MPEWMFDDEHRVDDEAAYRVKKDGTLDPTPGEAIAPGSISLLLESPHKDEFDGAGGRALGPLRNGAVRKRFEKKAPALIRASAELTGLDPVGNSSFWSTQCSSRPVS